MREVLFHDVPIKEVEIPWDAYVAFSTVYDALTDRD
jgi:hypothetical protein